MSHQVLMRVDRVEFWKPPYNRDAPILTQIEVHAVQDHHKQTPVLTFEFRGESASYAPVRQVLNFPGEVRDYAPGDVLLLSIEKAPPPAPGEPDPDDVPF